MLGSMAASLRLLSKSGTHEFAAVGDLLLYYWQGEVSLASIRASRGALLDVHRRHPEGVRVLAIVETGTNIPDSHVRDLSATIAKECAHCVRAHATVIPGHGFWVATARSVLGAVFFLSRTSYPRKVYATAHEALVWLSTFGTDAYRPVMAAHLQQLRSQDARLASVHPHTSDLR